MQLRNVAIIAHVDHGKTTLVDGLLHQAGTFGAHEDVAERVMDSMDLERERGITILSKNTAVSYGDTKINIVDTPGHADFGAEVERVLELVDGAILLVDASEGPLPQTRFVLRKALEKQLAIVVVVNKIDRADARIDEVLSEIYDLFIDLGADDRQIEFPVLYACARDGTCSSDQKAPGQDLKPLFEAIVEHVPAPPGDPNATPQLLITQLGHDTYLGRLAIGRVFGGTIHARDEMLLFGAEDSRKVRVSRLYTWQGLERVEAERVVAGDIVAVAGIDEVSIGDTFTSVDKPRPLPRVTVDEPTIGMTFLANTGPLSGREGKYVTARQIRERLEGECLHNVALRIEDAGSPEQIKVMGRGELQLAILLEQMRREGYEVCVSMPEVVQREVDGRTCEPYEHATLDFPEVYMGVISEKMALRRGRMLEMKVDGSGRARVEYRVPSRGLIGFRSEYLGDTRGEGLLNTLFDGYDELAGYIPMRQNGSLVADRKGAATPYALFHLQPRGKLFVPPGTEVYEGMIVGENARENDINVNVCRSKQLTNFRAAGADEKTILAPPVQMTLEKALEFIAEDELVEITPSSIRLRKKVLAQNQRSVVRGEKRERRKK